MSAKYAFTQSLKEVRFLFCQTADHSAGVRSVFLGISLQILAKNTGRLADERTLAGRSS